jgi:flagellar protein FlgJ
MFDDQLSQQMTQGKGLGLADMLVRQLQHAGTSAGGTATGTTRAVPVNGAPAAPGAGRPASSAEQATFISQVWPQAEAAAQQLGVHPVSLVAQAALESNWGRSVPRGADGASSNNLFGIKAGSSWTGAAVTARTQEYQGRAAAPVNAAFRAYASPGESFQDYVAVLRANPRFSAALGSGNSVSGFATALQQGGYATDPDYAQKVQAVAGQVAAALKFGGALPMTPPNGPAPGEELSHG